MASNLKIYVGCIAAAAIAFCATLDWGALASLQGQDWVGLAAFVIVAAFSQSVALDSTVGAAKPVQSSIAFLPLLALTALFPPPAVIVATAGVSAVSELILRDRVWHRAIFNVSQTALSFGLAALIFNVSAASLAAEPIGVDGFNLAAAFFPFYAAAISFFVLNLILVSTAVAIRQDERLSTVFLQASGRGGGNLGYDLLASPLALLAAFLYWELGTGVLLAIILPLLLVRHSYHSALQLQKVNRDLLRVLVKAIETRDPYTSGHSMRVSTLARMIAEDYGLRSAVVADVETAALLHDIGKIDALYAPIISKASSLTDREIEVIRTHATKGADLLESLTSLGKQIIDGVRHHHERFDGDGYPDGLVGKEIPIAGRIIMLCDSIDAMLSDRPYRRALPVQEVRKEIDRCSGTQFDPDIVRAILENNTIERADLLVERSGGRTELVRVVS